MKVFTTSHSFLVMLVLYLSIVEDARAGSFQGLGHLGGGTSQALGVSADGQVVVGVSNTGTRDEAFRWTAGTGISGLGVISGGSSAANATSAAGSVIVGRSGNGADDVAFRWTAASGMQSLGVLSDGRSEAFDVSADGSVVVGVSGKEGTSCSNFPPPSTCVPSPPPGTEQAFRWTAAGMVGLGTLPVGAANGSQARKVSADGSVVVGDLFVYQLSCFPNGGGFCVYFRTTVHAFRWTQSSGLQDITGTVSSSTAQAISADGSVVVGQSESQAAKWDAGADAVSLGLFGIAKDASADGTVIVGNANQGGAFFWLGTPAFLKVMLMHISGLPVAGWTLAAATGVSDDGRTIVGWGTNPLGQMEGWIARLDRLPTTTELDSLPQLSNPVLSAVLPLSRSTMVGTIATVFASILNRGPLTATGCRIALATPVAVRLDYNTTDPVTNQTIGPQNTPIDIPRGGSQSFVVGFTPTAAFPPTDVSLAFDCANTLTPAPTISGLNTVLLSASTTVVPDIVALGATTGNNGIVEIAGTNGIGAFAVATVNVGIAAQITASADTGSVALPLNISLCQTNPTTGVCVGAPARSVITQINAGQTPTFSIFVAGTGSNVPFDPAHNRIFVRFKDTSGVTRGATSVAVRTQ